MTPAGKVPKQLQFFFTQTTTIVEVMAMVVISAIFHHEILEQDKATLVILVHVVLQVVPAMNLVCQGIQMLPLTLTLLLLLPWTLMSSLMTSVTIWTA